MKRMTKITTLLLALMTVLMMSQAVFAADTPVAGGTYRYDGTQIVTEDVESINALVSSLEPGDSVTIEQTYYNDTDNTTNWYIKNTIIQTLEESAEAAENGGYSYTLEAGGQTLFTSDAVGGRESASNEEGMRQINDAITGESAGEDWIRIDTLESQATGKTRLTIALDGESQTNGYEGTTGELTVSYAVEDLEVGETIIEYKKGVDTGDTTNLLLPLVAFLAALLLLVLAVISFRKDRKDGEEA